MLPSIEILEGSLKLLFFASTDALLSRHNFERQIQMSYVTLHFPLNCHPVLPHNMKGNGWNLTTDLPDLRNAQSCESVLAPRFVSRLSLSLLPSSDYYSGRPLIKNGRQRGRKCNNDWGVSIRSNWRRRRTGNRQRTVTVASRFQFVNLIRPFEMEYNARAQDCQQHMERN